MGMDPDDSRFRAGCSGAVLDNPLVQSRGVNCKRRAPQQGANWRRFSRQDLQNSSLAAAKFAAAGVVGERAQKNFFGKLGKWNCPSTKVVLVSLLLRSSLQPLKTQLDFPPSSVFRLVKAVKSMW